MIRFLTVLACLLILAFLAGGCLGLYYLVDSSAVERGVAKVLDRTAEGMYAVLICAAIGVCALGLGFGLRAGAVPAAQAVSHFLMSKEMAGSIHDGRSARLPGGYEVSDSPARISAEEPAMLGNRDDIGSRLESSSVFLDYP